MADGAYTQVGGLDDEQVYDQDSLKRNYIMWKTSQEGGGIEKQRERREKKNHRSTKGCISSQNKLFK